MEKADPTTFFSAVQGSNLSGDEGKFLSKSVEYFFSLLYGKGISKNIVIIGSGQNTIALDRSLESNFSKENEVSVLAVGVGFSRNLFSLESNVGNMRETYFC